MKTGIPVTFGSAIKEARVGAGMSMGQLAEAVGISKSLLRFWELDAVEAPDVSKVLRLATVLGVDSLHLAALAGYELSDTLPPVQPYLRSKYPDLPESALAEIASVVRRHGIDPTRLGPTPGEDETDAQPDPPGVASPADITGQPEP